MISLYKIFDINQPWKQELIGNFKTPEDMMKKAGMTRGDVTYLLEAAADADDDAVPGRLLDRTSGKTDERFYILFENSYLMNLGVSVIREDRDDLTQEEVADIIGISQQTVNEIMRSALSKLRRKTKIKTLLQENITTRAKILISY